MIIDIIRSNFKIIIFGFVFTFFSSVGQSFFIGLFNSSIREEINISHGEFGTIYGIATLCSSFTLIWLGKKIDELKLFNYSFLIVRDPISSTLIPNNYSTPCFFIIYRYYGDNCEPIVEYSQRSNKTRATIFYKWLANAEFPFA